MKLTWFGGNALRIYLGGEIVVVDPEDAPEAIDQSELRSGAAAVVHLGVGATVPMIDPATWRPKAAPRLVDERSGARLEIARIASRALLVAAAGEPPLVVLGGGEAPRFGRWADGAVIVLTVAQDALVSEATVLLDVARPRLIALAVDTQALDSVIAEIAEHLDGVGLVSLEPGLAVEV